MRVLAQALRLWNPGFDGVVEQIAYLLKQRYPRLFRCVEASAQALTCLRFGRRIADAQNHASLEGSLNDAPASIRPLDPSDAEVLHEFLTNLPNPWLRYFQPHPFELTGLKKVLRSRAFMNYGLFVGGEMIGYALLKVAPTGSAFIGLLVHPKFGRLGLGKFIVAFLYWQSSLAGLKTRSTINRHNSASLKSHKAVSEYEIVAELPNDYVMIEFPNVKRTRPELVLP